MEVKERRGLYHWPMSPPASIEEILRKRLQDGDLPFNEFVGLVLYHPTFGYYSGDENPVGKGADYVTAPLLSPVFSFALGNLVREFLRRSEGEVCSIVDIGCGDGSLIRDLSLQAVPPNARFFGVDRSRKRIPPGETGNWKPATSMEEIPKDGMHLILSNELYDAFPFSRVLRRGERIHELCVTWRDEKLEWSERRAPDELDRYFDDRGIELSQGQFADVSLEWEAFHARVVRSIERGLIITIDYGFPANKLFDPRARRYGTAAAYSGQRVSRDLLANPGGQDLTAHINFSDLERAGARNGAQTIFFDRLAKFLLALDITSHELFRPVHEVTISDAHEGLALMQAREDARRLVLPDGIGLEMSVLVQAKGISSEGWGFQRELWTE